MKDQNSANEYILTSNHKYLTSLVGTARHSKEESCFYNAGERWEADHPCDRKTPHPQREKMVQISPPCWTLLNHQRGSGGNLSLHPHL